MYSLVKYHEGLGQLKSQIALGWLLFYTEISIYSDVLTES